jgi:hypothetical protein
LIRICKLKGRSKMMGWWESNINVWFPFIYSQKWNCAASGFLNVQNVQSANYTLTYVRDLYIYKKRICLSILLQPNMWTDHGKIAHRQMKEEIGTDAAPFLFWKYKNCIFGTV